MKAALGYDITKEELGGEHIHVQRERQSIDNLADDRGHAFAMIRAFLSYLPDNVWELPPRGETGDDPQRRDEETLLSLIPRDPPAASTTRSASSRSSSTRARSSRSPRRTAVRASPDLHG